MAKHTGRMHLSADGPRPCEAASEATCRAKFLGGGSPHFQDAAAAEGAYHAAMEAAHAFSSLSRRDEAFIPENVSPPATLKAHALQPPEEQWRAVDELVPWQNRRVATEHIAKEILESEAPGRTYGSLTPLQREMLLEAVYQEVAFQDLRGKQQEEADRLQEELSSGKLSLGERRAHLEKLQSLKEGALDEKLKAVGRQALDAWGHFRHSVDFNERREW